MNWLIRLHHPHQSPPTCTSTCLPSALGTLNGHRQIVSRIAVGIVVVPHGINDGATELGSEELGSEGLVGRLGRVGWLGRLTLGTARG